MSRRPMIFGLPHIGAVNIIFVFTLAPIDFLRRSLARREKSVQNTAKSASKLCDESSIVIAIVTVTVEFEIAKGIGIDIDPHRRR